MKRILLALALTLSTLAHADPSNVTLYKANPWSGKPAPTIIIAHGCDGLGRNPHYRNEAQKFNSWGWNAIVLDSFGPRGVSNDCTLPKKVKYGERKDDVLEAAEWAFEQSWHKGPFAVVGYSHGGTTALHVANAPENDLIKVALAYYPTCGKIGLEGDPYRFANPRVPTLVFHGSEDQWTRGLPCQTTLGERSNRPELYKLSMYPGATHAFDMPFPDRVSHGHPMRYCSTCTTDADNQIHKALNESITNPAPAHIRMDKR